MRKSWQCLHKVIVASVLPALETRSDTPPQRKSCIVLHVFYVFVFVLSKTYFCAHDYGRFCVVRVVGEDDFFADLGISYKDFDMPDEIDDYYEAKEDPATAKDP